jgi:hypothetical protein
LPESFLLSFSADRCWLDNKFCYCIHRLGSVWPNGPNVQNDFTQ